MPKYWITIGATTLRAFQRAVVTTIIEFRLLQSLLDARDARRAIAVDITRHFDDIIIVSSLKHRQHYQL